MNVTAGPIVEAGSVWEEYEATFYGLTLRFLCNEPAFLAWIEYLLPEEHLAGCPGAPPGIEPRTVEYRITLCPEYANRGAYAVRKDGEFVWGTRDAAMAQAYMEQQVFLELVAHLQQSPHHLVHSAVVARDGHGIMLPAQSGSGKSTLTAALALAGFEYFSDEIAVLTEQGTALPFPKAMTVKYEAWDSLTAEFPDARALAYSPPYSKCLRHVQAPCGPVNEVPVELFIVPRYLPDRPTALTRARGALMLQEFALRTLNMDTLKNRAFDIAATVARQARCYYLSVGDLSSAVRLIDQAVDELAAIPADEPAPVSVSP